MWSDCLQCGFLTVSAGNSLLYLLWYLLLLVVRLEPILNYLSIFILRGSHSSFNFIVRLITLILLSIVVQTLHDHGTSLREGNLLCVLILGRLRVCCTSDFLVLTVYLHLRHLWKLQPWFNFLLILKISSRFHLSFPFEKDFKLVKLLLLVT